MSDAHLISLIQKGLLGIDQTPQDHPVEAYIAYLRLLQQWNRAYNLTAITDPEKIITHHLIDSLSVISYIEGVRCLDVGSGAGLPGLILALARPDQHWTLLDSNSKKTRFLKQVLLELNLTEVEVKNMRVEDFELKKPFTTIITRAYGSVLDFYQKAQPLISENGVLISMKGSYPEEEINKFKSHFGEVKCEVVKLSNDFKNRHLVMIK